MYAAVTASNGSHNTCRLVDVVVHWGVLHATRACHGCDRRQQLLQDLLWRSSRLEQWFAHPLDFD